MTGLELGVVWISGFIVGLTTMAAVVYRIGSKALKKPSDRLTKSLEDLSELMDKLPKNTIDDIQYAAIEPRMTRIREIAQTQVQLQAAADGPQRNAMDGKYKNGLMGELKSLEEEKVAILTSIVKDGFDPPVNVLKEDGTTEVTKLSTFLSGYSSDVGKPNEEAPIKNVGRFVVHKGGKDDSGNPTTH